MKKDKVICISDKWKVIDQSSEYTFPIKGEIYTIRDLFIAHGIYVIRLVEIINPMGIEMEAWFDLRGFRPIDYTFAETILENILKEQIEELQPI